MQSQLRRIRLAPPQPHDRAPRVVVIGGGTGQSSVLRALRALKLSPTAIVAVTDTGGSSGRLKEQFNVPALGDLRACLVALADPGRELIPVFRHRFKCITADAPLCGHSFGNVALAALMESNGGDLLGALRTAGWLLRTSGRVLPCTLDPVELTALMADGSVIAGETEIVFSGLEIVHLTLNPATVAATPCAVRAILDANMVLLAPGSLYTSLLPNLLVQGLAEALECSPAKKVYICNTTMQCGETEGFSASDHLRVLEDHIGRRVADYVLMNGYLGSTVRAPGGTALVAPQPELIAAMGYNPIVRDLVRSPNAGLHDCNLLARAILELIPRDTSTTDARTAASDGAEKVRSMRVNLQVKETYR